MHAAVGSRFLGVQTQSPPKEINTCQQKEELTANRLARLHNASALKKGKSIAGISDFVSLMDRMTTSASQMTNLADSGSENLTPSNGNDTDDLMPDTLRSSADLASGLVKENAKESDEMIRLQKGSANHSGRFLTGDTTKSEETSHKDNEKVFLISHRPGSVEDTPIEKVSDLNTKVLELQETLARLQKESNDKIEKLQQESENASKTIERLQLQLNQQADYGILKREIQILRSSGSGLGNDVAPNAILAAAIANPLTSTPSSTTSSLTLTPPPPVPLTSGPPSGGSPSTLTSSGPQSSLEQLLVERAKAIRQANPALKAFADIQGPPQFPSLGGPIRHPLFHPHGGLPQSIEALSLMNEEMVAQWRQSLQRSPLGTLGLSPYHPLSSQRSSGDSLTPLPPAAPMTPPSIITAPRTPIHGQKFHADASPDRIGSPSNGHSSPTPERPDSASNFTPTATNGGSTAQSEVDEVSSPARLDSKSPFKSDERPSPNLPINFPGPPGLNLQFPGLHMSVSPLVSSGRIPKSDPMEGRLQDMLRYNMEKYAGQALDTLGTSRRVRELLSIHNIGQRLFAKYVLGLSQGTVSELLSKPKCWEKLTEKGRDSYRKMHAWAYDENAVMMLKSLIPRKDDRPPVNPGFNFAPEGSEERIAKILNEANKAMNSNSGKDSANASPAAPPTNPLSFSSQLFGSSPMSEDSPHENLSKMYKEEFSRLMQESRLSEKQSPEALAMAAAGLPFFPGLGSSFFSRGGPPPDFQRAMDIYHQEFSRLQQNALAVALRAHQGDPDGSPFGVGSSNRDEGSTSGGRDDVDENNDTNETLDKPCSPGDSNRSGANSPSDCGQDSPIGKGSGSKLFPPPPLQHIGDDLAGSLSPLQRMASITNSLVSQPSLTPQAGHQQRTHRAILPPITQQQFDRFQHLNTDDVVRRVKEILSQYSISQRLFGEHVLALSQGSVSDLLARPKPWHMLTQKGREPFIRMKLFLDDENAVHKLVASQYKIAPDKLMRTGNYGGSLQIPPKQLTKVPDFHHSLHDVLPASFRFAQESLQDRSPPILDPLSLQRKLISQKANANLTGGVIPNAPSLYEMAALTHELDTQGVTTKVKEILLANNVGQKLFGEAVLGLSQGSVSELLSKPKPWHMLSIKGREPFIRMQLWLNDPLNIEKLQALKSERKDVFLTKRKRLGGGGVDSSSDRSSPADSSDMYANQIDSPGSAKKQRVLFTDEQKEALNVAFTLEPYPSTATMDFLSQELNLEPRSISNWFHNHRMRLKQHLPQAAEQLSLLAAKEGQTFDPIKFRLLLHQRLLDVRSDESGSRGPSEDFGFPANFHSILRQFGSLQSSLDQLCPKDKDDREIGSGLDLTYKRDDNDKEDSIAESQSDDEDSSRGLPAAKRLREDPESESEDSSRENATRSDHISKVSVSSRSRRKPAAPQWVRPDWMEAGDASDDRTDDKPPASDDDDGLRAKLSGLSGGATAVSDKENNLTINGVCVMNSYALNKSFDGINNKSPVADRPEDKSDTIL